MRSRLLWTIALAGLLASCGPAGCVSSLQPLYTDDDRVFETALLGVWEGEDSTLRVERSGETAYLVTATHESRSSQYQARLIRFGQTLLVDLSQDDAVLEEIGKTQYFPLVVRVHFICRVEVESDELRVACLDGDWLEKRRAQGKLGIAHQSTEDGIVLAGSTKELRAFVRKHAGTDEAFQELSIWRRSG